MKINKNQRQNSFKKTSTFLTSLQGRKTITNIEINNLAKALKVPYRGYLNNLIASYFLTNTSGRRNKNYKWAGKTVTEDIINDFLTISRRAASYKNGIQLAEPFTNRENDVLFGFRDTKNGIKMDIVSKNRNLPIEIVNIMKKQVHLSENEFMSFFIRRSELTRCLFASEKIHHLPKAFAPKLRSKLNNTTLPTMTTMTTNILLKPNIKMINNELSDDEKKLFDKVYSNCTLSNLKTNLTQMMIDHKKLIIKELEKDLEKKVGDKFLKYISNGIKNDEIRYFIEDDVK